MIAIALRFLAFIFLFAFTCVAILYVIDKIFGTRILYHLKRLGQSKELKDYAINEKMDYLDGRHEENKKRVKKKTIDEMRKKYPPIDVRIGRTFEMPKQTKKKKKTKKNK